MSAETNAMPGPADAAADTAATAVTRPFYWSVRRELWENRSLYLAPLIAAGFVLLGFLLSAWHFSDGLHSMTSLDLPHQREVLIGLYSQAAMLIVLTMSIVAWFYCLDSLHGERRDRSILFWRSLPVSDLTTVLSKCAIPTIVLPLIAFAVVIATQLTIMLISTIILFANGLNGFVPWTQLPLLEMWLVLLYGLVVVTLWFAPIYGWLMLVSAWARRATFLWAVMPPLAIIMIEGLALHTSHFWSLIKYRFAGGFAQAFVTQETTSDVMAEGKLEMGRSVHVWMPEHLSQIFDPVRFLSNPSLWIGLAVAAGFVAAAVWLRRYREPL